MDERTTPGLNAALSIAGSDSSGGAGLQADLKTWSAMEVYGASVVTVITAQNTQGVQQIENLDPALIEQQIDSVASDIVFHATKVGLVGTPEAAQAIAKMIKRYNLQPLVVDPVMVSKSGASLADDAAVAGVTSSLFPLAAVVTPNRHEAARLTGGQDCETINQGAAAARQIARKYGCHAVIVTGFTRPGPEVDSPPEAVDVFWNGEEIEELVGEKRQSDNLHGAGCVFSAAIAGGLVQGLGLRDAVHQAKRVVTEAIRQNLDFGRGCGPVNPLAWIHIKK